MVDPSQNSDSNIKIPGRIGFTGPEQVGVIPEPQKLVQQAMGKDYQPSVNAYKNLGSETANRIADAIRQNPNLANSPDALYALSNYKLDGTTLGRVSQYLELTDRVRNIMEEQTSRAKNTPSFHIDWGNIFPSIGRQISGVWHAAQNAFTPKIGVIQGPNASTGDVVQNFVSGGLQNLQKVNNELGAGAGQGVKDIFNIGADVANRAADTAVELGTAGYVQPDFNNWSFKTGAPLAGLKDAFDTVNNFGNGVLDLANPFSQNNAFSLMDHTMAFYETLVNKRGSNYALGYLTPSIMAALMTDGALNPAETAAAEGLGAADESLVSRLTEAAKTRDLTPEEQDSLKAAQERLAELNKASQKTAALRKAMNETRAKAAEFTERASTPVKYAFKGLRAASKPQSSVRANIAYLVTQEMVKKDPELAKIWEQTRDGSVFDASGRRIGTMGQATASAFGLPKGAIAFDTMSGLTDLYTKYIGNDPFGIAGKAIGTARSYGGFSGALGALYGGLGIRNADDVFRAYDQYRGFRQAVDYIVNSDSAGGIMTQFRGLYSREIANELAKATTANEVLLIHAKYAEAFEMLNAKAPTMGMYSALKATVRDSGMELGKFLMKDDAFVAHLEEQEAAGKFITSPADAAMIGTDSPTVRWRSVFGRWLLTRLTRNPMYFDETANAMESVYIKPGKDSSVPAIMDMARLALMPESQVKFIGDLLLRTENADDFVSVYQQLCTHILYRRVMAGLPEAKYDAIKQILLNNIWDRAKMHAGVDGGGEKGLHANGEQGGRDSVVDDGTHAAIDNSGLGRLKIFSAHDISRVVSELRRVVKAMEGNAVEVDQFIQNLGEEELRASMRVLGVDEKTITKNVFDVLQGRIEHSLGASLMDLGGRSAYRTKGTEIAARLRAFMRNKDRTTLENLVEFYEYLGTQQTAAHSALQAVEDYFNLHGTVEVMGEDAIKAFGDRMGMPDIINRDGKVLISDKLVQTLRGEAAAINDTFTGFHTSFAHLEDNTIPEMMADAAMLRKTRAEITEAEQRAQEAWDEKVTELRSTLRKGRNFFQFAVDGANVFLSKLFVPLALFSARWAQHVAVSELSLNSFRLGPWRMFDSMIATSITKHSLHGAPLDFLQEEGLLSEEKGSPLGFIMGHEPSFIRHVVAGALLGLERSVLDMSREEARQMVDNFAGAVIRHKGHLLLEMHGTGSISDESKANAREKVYQKTKNGTETHTVLYSNDDFTSINPGELMHAQAMSDNLTEISLPKNMASKVVLALHDILITEGNKAYAANPAKFIEGAVKDVQRWFDSKDGREAMGAITKEMSEAFAEFVKNSTLKDVSERQLEKLRQEFVASLPDAEAVIAGSMKDYLKRQYEAKAMVIERASEDAAAIRAKIEDYNNKIAVELQAAAKRGITVAKVDDTTKAELADLEQKYSVLDNQIKTLETEIRDHPFRVIISDTNSRAITDAFKGYSQLIDRARAGIQAEKATATARFDKLAEEYDKAVQAELETGNYEGTFIYDNGERPAGTAAHQVRKDNAEIYERRIASAALPGSGDVIDARPFTRGMGRTELLEGERRLSELDGFEGLDKMVRDNNIAHAARVLSKAIKSGRFGMSRSMDELGAVEAWNYLAGEGMLDGFTHYQEYMPLGRTETEVQRAWVRNHYVEGANAHDFFESGRYLPDGMTGFGSFDEFQQYYDGLIKAMGTNPAFGDVRTLDEADMTGILKTIDKDYETIRGGQFDPLRNREFPYDPTNDLGQVSRLGEAWAGHFFGGVEGLRDHALEQEVANATAATVKAGEQYPTIELSDLSQDPYKNTYRYTFAHGKSIYIEHNKDEGTWRIGENIDNKTWHITDDVKHPGLPESVFPTKKQAEEGLIQWINSDPEHFDVRPISKSFSEGHGTGFVDFKNYSKMYLQDSELLDNMGGNADIYVGTSPNGEKLVAKHFRPGDYWNEEEGIDPEIDHKIMSEVLASKIGFDLSIPLRSTETASGDEGDFLVHPFIEADENNAEQNQEELEFFFGDGDTNPKNIFDRINNERPEWWTPRRIDDAKRIKLFDMLTGIGDRHSGNVIATADGGLVGIDHESIFDASAKKTPTQIVELLESAPFSRGEIYDLNKQIEELKYWGGDNEFEKERIPQLCQLWEDSYKLYMERAGSTPAGTDTATFFGHPSAPSHGDPRFRSAEDVWAEMQAKHANYAEDQGYRMDYEKKVQQKTSLTAVRGDLSKKINDLRKQSLDAADATGASARIDRLEQQIKQAESDLAMTQAKHDDAMREQAEIVSTHNRVMTQRVVRAYQRDKMSEELKQAMLDSKNKKLMKKVMPRVRNARNNVAKYYVQSLNTNILRAGASQFSKQEEIDRLIEQLLPVAREEIAKNPDAERFARNLHARAYDEVRYSDDPREDWAHVLAKHVVETVTGHVPDGRIIHPELVEQAATGRVMHGQAMADLMFKMGDKAPRNIRGRSIVSDNWQKAGAATDFLQRVAEVGHAKVLGPIVNSMVRTPTWLLEYHTQYQRLRGMIADGRLTAMEAEVLADYNATLNMSKFVHNPLEKTAWEVNMRAAAPFYFAQNQAWRRAFRLMAEDPGAFERYLKACLGVTDYISVQSGGGNIPSVFIPGSSLIGQFGAGSFLGKGLPGMAFGLAADPGSVSSMVPTGADMNPVNMFSNIIRPAWGPLVTIAAKTFFQNGWFKTNPLTQKYLKAFLGDVSYNSSIFDNIVPSSQVKDYLNALQGSSSAEVTAQTQVIGNYIDDLYAKTRQDVLNQYDWSGYKGAQKAQLVQAYVDYDVSQKLNDPRFRQDLLERAHNAAKWMLLAKATINLVSPLATSLQQRFSLQPELNALIKQKGSLIDAMTEFTVKYPDHLADLVTHTMPTYGPFPETVAAQNLIENHSDVVRQFPFATAYLASRASQTDPQALQIEMMQGLRTREAPATFLDNLRIAIGNDYYYNYLLPKYQAVYGQKTEITIGGQTQEQIGLSYIGAKALAAEAKQYGDNYNPVWYEDHTGANRKDNANQAFKDMQSLLASSEANQVMSKEDKRNFQKWVSGYENVQKNILQLRADNNKHEAYLWENWWFASCTAAAQDPRLANQAYFISTVLRKMPGI